MSKNKLHVGHKSKSLTQKQRTQSRFTTLLLEYGEKSLFDWAVVLGGTAIEGRLRLCSRSVVFEPVDINRGIMRCPLDRMKSCPSRCRRDENCVGWAQTRHFLMKAMNIIGPFETVTEPTKFQFSFLHSSPQKFLDTVEKLYTLIKNDVAKSNAHSLPLKEMLQPVLDRPFDPSNFVDLRERPLTTNLRCSILTPLVSDPGCAVLTNDRIYFQAAGIALSNETGATFWMIRDIVASARRYDGLKDCALELFMKDETSVLLSFDSNKERELVMNLMPVDIACHTDPKVVLEAVNQWSKGVLSNFEYLLLLNSAAGRSFNDLSRYPVFPWVIADYTSTKLNLDAEETFRDFTKPIGALNEERLRYFQQRLEGMQDIDHPFLYGTHYSAPGYVLYYLVRCMPEHMLCLQNGKFDSPDRMFHSLDHTYSSVLTNHADVKELIPEFYDTSSGSDFLINARNLPLGNTQLGNRVHDCRLPRWAKSPRDFIRKNRKALESPICSRNLPSWIDLIFGINSRGANARQHSNLFHKTAYLGPEDLQLMESDNERAHAELHAMEFGIVPDLLFTANHPQKGGGVIEEHVRRRCNNYSGISASGSGGGVDARASSSFWEILEPFKDGEGNEGGRDRFWSSWSAGSSAPGSREGSRDRLGSAESVRSIIQLEGAEINPSPMRFFSLGRDSDMDHSGQASDDALSNTSKKNQWHLSFGRNKSERSFYEDKSVSATSEVNSLDNEDQAANDRRRARASSAPDAPDASDLMLVEAEVDDLVDVAALENDLLTPKAHNKSVRSVSADAAVKTNTASPMPKQSGNKFWPWMSHSTNDIDVIKPLYRSHIIAVKKCDAQYNFRCCSLSRANEKDWYVTAISQRSGLQVYSMVDKCTKKTSVFKKGFFRTGEDKFSKELDPLASHQLSNNEEMFCLSTVSVDGDSDHIAFVGGAKNVIAYGISAASVLTSLVDAHSDSVIAIDVTGRLSPIYGNSSHLLVTCGSDNTVKVWSLLIASGTVAIERKPLTIINFETKIECVAVEFIDKSVYICVGCQGGFNIWRWKTGEENKLVWEECAEGTGCIGLKWIRPSTESSQPLLCAAYKHGGIKLYQLQCNGEMSLNLLTGLHIDQEIKSFDANRNVVVVGFDDGTLNYVIVEDAVVHQPHIFYHEVGVICGLNIVEIPERNNTFMCSAVTVDGTLLSFELSER